MRGAPVTIPRSAWVDLRRAEGPALRLFLSWPATPPPARGYPLLLLLDGNAVFATAAEAAVRLAHRPDRTGVTPGVVAALGYAEEAPYAMAARAHDYAGPGAGAFLAAIERRVLPLAARRLPIDTTRRTLFGHSFGGLFALGTLLTRPGLFRTFVAASPSVWWDRAALLRAAEAWQGPLDAAPRLLLLAGGQERPEAEADPARAARAQAADMLGNLDRVDWLLSARGVQVQRAVLDGEDHGSAVLPAVGRAVRAAFRGDA